MKSSLYPKLPGFIYRFLILEFVGELILSLLPTSWRDGFLTEFLLRGLLFLSLIIVTIWSFALWKPSRFFRELKARGFIFLIPFLLLLVRIILIPIISEFTQNSKFYVAQKGYKEVVYLAEHHLLKQKLKDYYLNSPSKYWYIGGGTENQMKVFLNDGRRVILFREFGEFNFFSGDCGFFYSSSAINPNDIGEALEGYVFDIKQVSEQWFFGCVSSMFT